MEPSPDIQLIADKVHTALIRRRDARRCGELPRVVPAMVLAVAFAIRPGRSRESRRRAVRSIIHHLRHEDHVPVLSTDKGYYLGTEPADFAEAEKHARRSGLAQLALAANTRHAPERAEACGQLALFG